MAGNPAKPGMKSIGDALGKALAHQKFKPKPKPRKATRASIKGGFDRATAKAIEAGISAGDRRAIDFAVTKEAQAHGKYELVDYSLVEVVEGGKTKAKTSRVIRNNGGTPVDRWHNAGKLDQRQMAAIMFYQHAWRLWIGHPRVVANYSAMIVRDAISACDVYANSAMAAKESLKLLDQEIFFRLELCDFHVWQNVVIWDQASGIAGMEAGFVGKQASAAALKIIQIISRQIADLVIDNCRRDFGDLILDIDAPRRPRK